MRMHARDCRCYMVILLVGILWVFLGFLFYLWYCGMRGFVVIAFSST